MLNIMMIEIIIMLIIMMMIMIRIIILMIKDGDDENDPLCDDSILCFDTGHLVS